MVSFTGYDDYLDDDDLDLIEENLGVKVKRRVSMFFMILFPVFKEQFYL